MGLGSCFYKKSVVHRWEKAKYLKFFTKEELGLLSTPYEFESKGITLRGNFYYIEGFKEDHLVVFCHGIGDGHCSYMTEISMLCKAGYKVLAFDYIGCDTSDGKNSISMCESLVNLHSCLKSLDNTEYKDKKISVIGHSWGGYAVSNIANFYDNLNAIIDISGFISMEELVNQFCSGKLKIFRRDVKRYERKTNPNYYDSCAITALNKTKARVLVIHDKLDDMVKYSYSSELLVNNVTNPNVKFLITEGKYHQPQYESISYYKEVFTDYSKKIKAKKLKTLEAKLEFFKDVDWCLMVKPDETIWNEVYKTIEGE